MLQQRSRRKITKTNLPHAVSGEERDSVKLARPGRGGAQVGRGGAKCARLLARQCAGARGHTWQRTGAPDAAGVTDILANFVKLVGVLKIEGENLKIKDINLKKNESMMIMYI